MANKKVTKVQIARLVAKEMARTADGLAVMHSAPSKAFAPEDREGRNFQGQDKQGRHFELARRDLGRDPKRASQLLKNLYEFKICLLLTRKNGARRHRGIKRQLPVM
jgi:hypothetical protein